MRTVQPWQPTPSWSARARAVAFLTSAGFRDLLYIGRQDRPALYDIYPRIPPPLIPRERCYEVPERLDYRGDVLVPLDIRALDRVLDQVAADGIDAIAVCFLFSHVNAEHEQRVKRRVLERGIVADDWQVVLSSEVLPEFREYERASTVALEAYVRPVMSRYIGELEAKLPPSASLRIMKSDGGVMRARRVRQRAIHTALSGPAAGVMGAHYLAHAAGFEKIITLDMGGTSTDVALISGRPEPRPESLIDGLPLRVRMLDIETIGAGGGSIARVDAGGALRVGPESAGATPGPAVYGLGGTQATLSDANAILGRLDAEHFLGGNMTLDLKAGERALEELARRIAFNLVDAAKGVVDIANVNIDRAIRQVSIARGNDPRDFTLVAFGGAGPLHACEAADRLDIPRVLVPPAPGVLCALGLLIADVAVDFSQSVMRQASAQAWPIWRRLKAICWNWQDKNWRRRASPAMRRSLRQHSRCAMRARPTNSAFLSETTPSSDSIRRTSAAMGMPCAGARSNRLICACAGMASSTSLALSARKPRRFRRVPLLKKRRRWVAASSSSSATS